MKEQLIKEILLTSLTMHNEVLCSEVLQKTQKETAMYDS